MAIWGPVVDAAAQDDRRPLSWPECSAGRSRIFYDLIGVHFFAAAEEREEDQLQMAKRLVSRRASLYGVIQILQLLTFN